MSVICEKGAIRNALAGIESLPIELPLYEVIDNREHSKSKMVFIDIDMHYKKIVFDKIDEWYEEKNIEKEVKVVRSPISARSKSRQDQLV